MNQNENIFFWSEWLAICAQAWKGPEKFYWTLHDLRAECPVWYFLSVKFPHNWYVFKKSINLKEQRLFKSKNFNDLFLQLSVQISVITSTSKLVSRYWEGGSVYLKSRELWKELKRGVTRWYEGFEAICIYRNSSFAMQIQWEGVSCYFHV